MQDGARKQWGITGQSHVQQLRGPLHYCRAIPLAREKKGPKPKIMSLLKLCPWELERNAFQAANFETPPQPPWTSSAPSSLGKSWGTRAWAAYNLIAVLVKIGGKAPQISIICIQLYLLQLLVVVFVVAVVAAGGGTADEDDYDDDDDDDDDDDHDFCSCFCSPAVFKVFL